MAAAPIRTGKRVYLAAPRSRDASELIAVVRASRALHGRWISPPDTPEAFAKYLRRCAEPSTEGLLVRHLGDHSLVGALTLSQIVRGHFLSAYLGYWANAAHQGTGLMSEGLELTLDYTFLDLGLHRLEANIQPENDTSRRLVTGRGFRLEGFSPRYLFIDHSWRDHERWAITVEDWLDRQSA